jgi:hypothetical protein
LADLKGEAREAVGKAQSSEDVLTFAYMKMITSIEEPEPGVFKIDFLPLACCL